MPALSPLPAANPLPLPGEPRQKPPFVRAFEGELEHVYRTFRRFGFAEADAEDLAQEVFLVMWRRWNEYDPERPLRPWLLGISFRVAQHHRRKRREVLGVVLEVEDESAGPHEHLAAKRARTLVLTALGSLPERHRTALVMSDLDGLAMPAVAEALAIPLATAYTRVRRARLAFAEAVTRLQKEAPDARAGERVVAFEALLAYERPAPPLPAATRRRMEARAERALRHPLPQHSPLSQLSRLLTPTALSVGAAGIVALVAAGALVVRPVTFAPTAAHASVAQPQLSATEAARPLGGPTRRPPRLSSRALASGVPAEQRLARGLTGYWRFDEGESAIQDLSSNGRQCRVRGADPARAISPEGVHGNALWLHGRGWLECDAAESDATSPREVSVAAWVQPDRPMTFHRSILSREVTSSNHDDLFLGFAQGALQASSAVWSARAQFSDPIKPGRWTHVAATQLPDGVVVLYVDGVEAARKQMRLRRPLRGERRLLIAAGYDSKGHHVGQKFHGMIDEVVIYDRALGPEEVAALAAGTQPALSE
jgi:RNA polymerase sigma factor (sigma-70 family)